jgi:hypothetical protein
MNFLQRRFFIRPRTPIFLAIITLVVIFGAGLGLRQPSAQAQDGGTLQYGDAKLGIVSSANGVIYQFEGGAGDAVEVELLGIGGFRPTVTIYSADGSVVAQNENANNTNVINLTATLPNSETYTIQVQGREGATGQFTISLQGTPTANGGGTGGPDGVAGSDGAVPIVGQVSPDNPEETYIITLDPSGFIKVTVRSLTAGYTPVVRLEDEAGNVVALFNGQFLSGITIELPPGNGQLILIVALGNFGGVAEFGVSTTAGVVDECVISTDLDPGIDIHSGGSDAHPVIGLIDMGVEVAAVGQNNGWYQIALSNDRYGWVDGQLVMTTGLCAFLPTADYPEADGTTPDVVETEEAGPDETEEADGTATASYTPTDGPSPTNTLTPSLGPSPTQTATLVGPSTTPSYTATFTPSYTATFTPSYTHTFTPSYTPTTPPPPQTAPPDANYTLTIPLDNTASVLDFVSYPDGDREDRVAYSVSGMNPNSSLSGGRARLVISVSCFGVNTDQVTFFTSGQNYTCGQTVVDREVTADSDTGSVLITAIGGQGTYVQWVLTGTATRVN